MRLGDEDVEAIAWRVVELLEERQARRWGDVRAITSEYGLPQRWVYENAELLGGVKVGSSRSAPWRFDLDRVREILGDAIDGAHADGHAPASSNGHASASSNGHASAPAEARAPAPDAGAAAPVARPVEPGFDDVGRPLAKLDLSGRFVALNPSFARIVGYQEADFCRARWPSPHDREDYERQASDLRRLAAGELADVAVRSTYMHGHGLMVQLCGVLEVVRDAAGAPAHLVLKVERRQGE